MTKQQKVRQIQRKLAKLLIKQGLQFLQGSFKIEKKVFEKEQIKNFLKEKCNIPSMWLCDEKYYLTDWQTWQKIIEFDWLDEKEYINEIRDCDNFAYSFSSRMSNWFGLNSAGRCSGWVYSAKTGKRLGAHAFNLILAYDGKEIVPYLFEPMTDEWTIWKGQRTKLGNWEYQITWITCFERSQFLKKRCQERKSRKKLIK